MDTVVLFEGIASVCLDGVERDTYMTVRSESVGYTVRWYGSFGWMGQGTKLLTPTTADVTLSDGRECQIKVPNQAGDDGQLEFLGLGMPPGFEWFTEAELEVGSTTPSRWRQNWARVLMVVAVFLGVDAIWTENDRGRFLLTALLFFTSAIGMFVAQRVHEDRNRGVPLPEVTDE